MPTPELVTIDEVKGHIGIEADDPDFDAMLAPIIAAATESVLDLAEDFAETFDPETDEVPARLKLAVLAHVCKVFENRDAPEMPQGTIRLLGPFRTYET